MQHSWKQCWNVPCLIVHCWEEITLSTKESCLRVVKLSISRLEYLIHAAFSRGIQVVSFRFENRLPVPEHRNKQQQICISPEPGANAKWQWGQVGWMLADHRDGLSSSKFFSLILDSSVGLSAGIQSAEDWVSETLWVRILHSAEEDKLSPFDSKIACLCQSIEINNTYVCMYVCVYVYVCMYICTYVRMYISIYICITKTYHLMKLEHQQIVIHIHILFNCATIRPLIGVPWYEIRWRWRS